MKRAFLLVLCLPLLGGAQESPPSGGSVQATLEEYEPLFATTPKYRAPVRLDADDFSPFRRPESRAVNPSQGTLADEEVVALKVDRPAILSAFHELNLLGVIPSNENKEGAILLGSEVFYVGDMVQVRSGGSTSNRAQPLVPDHRIQLRSVTRNAIALFAIREGPEPKDGPEIIEIDLLSLSM